MAFPFARHVSERGHGHLDKVPVQRVELKTERVAMAYRLLFAYAFVRPKSEQNSSHLQIDCAGSLAIKLVTIEVGAQADLDAAFQVCAPHVGSGSLGLIVPPGLQASADEVIE
jgi:hypothetical protein